MPAPIFFRPLKLMKGCAIGIGVFAAAMAFQAEAVLASPGCTALNLTVGPNFTNFGQDTGTGFAAGDTITLTLVTKGPSGIVFLRDHNFVAITPNLTTSGASATYTVPANNPNSISVGAQAQTATSWRLTCVAAAVPSSTPSPTTSSTPTTNTDSQKLSSTQRVVTQVVSAQWTNGMSTTFDSVLSDAFTDGSDRFNGSGSGFSMILGGGDTAQPPETALAASVYNAFGINGQPTADLLNRRKPASTVIAPRPWSVWVNVQGAGWDNSGAGNSALRGQQVDALAGISYRLRPDLVVGMMGGYEQFNYDLATFSGSMKGRGGIIGSYLAWRVMPSIRFDLVGALAGMNYDASAGTANGSFTGNRYLLQSGLTGTYPVGPVTLEPSLKAIVVWDKQYAFTDSLGTAQSETLSVNSRLSTGGRAIYAFALTDSFKAAPYVGAYADWRLTDAQATDIASTGLQTGVTGRITAGLTLTQDDRISVTLGGDYGGIGASYKLWSAFARGTLRF